MPPLSALLLAASRGRGLLHQRGVPDLIHLRHRLIDLIDADALRLIGTRNFSHDQRHLFNRANHILHRRASVADQTAATINLHHLAADQILGL